ncbi:MAG TPA: cation:dicarboxylase symporter family transporter, partial [Bacteroidota bacterium]|nr:cation:dicarboxylase symporter family transporter [Bacteroidota bacterium]
MKLSWKSIPLHNKILGALVLGALFGVLFNVSKYELAVNVRGERGKILSETVKRWDRIEFMGKDSTILASFGPEDQLNVLRYVRGLSKEDRASVTMRVSGDEREAGSIAEWRSFTGIASVEKVKTAAVLIKPVGNIFIRLLMFISIPLVLASLIVGAASLGDIRRVGKLGGKAIVWYLITIVSAITIGLTLVNLIQPGKQLAPEAQEKLLVEFQTDVKAEVPPVDLVGMLVNIVATNPIKALAEGEMLQIVFFALMIGVSLTLVPAEKSKPVIDFFDGLSDTMIKMVGMIMNFAPYGVFALIAATVGEFGFDILETLFWYVLTLLIGLAIHTFGFLGVAVRIFSGIPYRKFFSGMKDAMLVAFTTSSSGATL